MRRTADPRLRSAMWVSGVLTTHDGATALAMMPNALVEEWRCGGLDRENKDGEV
jgi:hypothetical protein